MQQNLLGIIVAITLVVQVSILAALFFTTRRTMQKLEKTVTDLNDRAGPILTRVQILLDDTQPKISTMVAKASPITTSVPVTPAGNIAPTTSISRVAPILVAVSTSAISMPVSGWNTPSMSPTPATTLLSCEWHPAARMERSR